MSFPGRQVMSRSFSSRNKRHIPTDRVLYSERDAFVWGYSLFQWLSCASMQIEQTCESMFVSISVWCFYSGSWNKDEHVWHLTFVWTEAEMKVIQTAKHEQIHICICRAGTGVAYEGGGRPSLRLRRWVALIDVSLSPQSYVLQPVTRKSINMNHI